MEAKPGTPTIKLLETAMPRDARLGIRSEIFSVAGQSIWFFDEAARPVLSFICLRKIVAKQKEQEEDLWVGSSTNNTISLFFDDEEDERLRNPFYVDGWGMDGVFELNNH